MGDANRTHAREMQMKLRTVSMYRHDGGAAVKRQWGSSTVAEIWVYDDDQPDAPPAKIESFGRTPGDRKKYALNLARPAFEKYRLACDPTRFNT